MKRKTADRNREIFATYSAGEIPEEIARTYGLSPVTLRQIILTGMHKRAVSGDAFYAGLRKTEVTAPPTIRNKRRTAK